MKSSMMVAWACGLALGRDYGGFCPRAPGKTVIYNVEDDIDEQRRRLSATLRQFNAAPEHIQGRVITAGPIGVGTLFEVDAETGIVSETPAMIALRGLLGEHAPDMLIVDPLAELHTAQENDNGSLRSVIACFRALAVEFNMAAIVLHHTRKGAVVPGDPDVARGASSLTGAGRVVLTLCTMSEEDAEALGVAPDRKTRSRYVRLDDAKQNYAAIGDALWFEKVVHVLDNGEHVAAAEPWKPPDFWAGISTQVANRILDDIEKGPEPEPGRKYTHTGRTGDRSAWKVVAKHLPQLGEAGAKRVIREWFANDVLLPVVYEDPVIRKERNGLVVNHNNRPGAHEWRPA